MTEPLADGTYAAPGAGRTARMCLLLLAIGCAAAVVIAVSDVFSAVLLLVVAVLSLAWRALLGRPAMVISTTGVRVVGCLRSRLVPWQQVTGAGASAARGPLATAEQVLVIGSDEAALRVPVIRGPVEARTGRSPEVAEIAEALVARARIENGELAAAAEVVLPGGLHGAVLVDGTARRPAHPWTPTVQALLSHLHAKGVADVPQPLGFDAAGREVQSVVAGKAIDYPLPDWAWSDAALVSAAALLRRVHDATVDFVVPVTASWWRPAREPAEVVLHGDVAAYNILWSGGRAAGLIDWDTAHPGPRIADVAHAAYRLVPLTAPTHPDAPGQITEQVRRLPLFVAAYGLLDARGLVVELCTQLRQHLTRLAEDPMFAAHADHVPTYEGDLQHLEHHQAVLTDALR